MIDARESGGQSILGFLFAMWAVRRAGTGRSVMWTSISDFVQ